MQKKHSFSEQSVDVKQLPLQYTYFLSLSNS